jgi:hypothetical protein
VKDFLVLLSVVLASAVAARAETYTDPKAGFSLWYPSDLIPRRYDTYHGLDAVSRYGDVDLKAYAEPDIDNEPLEEVLNAERASREDPVTYFARGESWYVLSGVNSNGVEFYHRVSLVRLDGSLWWVDWEITYPHSRHTVCDRWVEQIAASFRLGH